MSKTKIVACIKASNCRSHAFQDKTYGKDKRVMNTGKAATGTKLTCTVCGDTKSIAAEKEETKDVK